MKQFILSLIVLIASPAHAKDKPTGTASILKSAPPAASQAKKIFKKTELHQFAGSKLKGQLKKPDLSYIYQRKGLRAEQIVNVPENFDQEIAVGAGQF